MAEIVDHARPPHASSPSDVLGALDVEPESGLATREALARLKAHGPNLLRHRKKTEAVEILLRQFVSPVVALLAAASAVALAFGDVLEAAAIAAVLVINTAIGFVSELRAVRSMEALRDLGRVTTRVRRDGRLQAVAAESLVPGDIVVLEAGDMVTADLRLVEAANLSVNESALTGESVPVEKNLEPIDEDAALAERASMVFKGTGIARGSGLGVVVGTGMATELGRISALVAEAEPERSPLEDQLDRLAGHLIWLTLGMCAAIAALGILTGGDLFLMIEAAIALAVAAIPEGLPIVATIALARGMWRMARKNALIERLAAVETLGSTTLICTDKTGTLTENRMTVERVAVASGDAELSEFEDATELDPLVKRALAIGVLCNDATPGEGGERASGDPVEVALLEAGQAGGLERDALEADAPRTRTTPFESETAMMATEHRARDGFRVCVKGAPEAVLEHAVKVMDADGEAPLDEAERETWLARTEELATDGLRMLAVAEKRTASEGAKPYEDLVFVGLVGLHDPAREDVPGAIRACHDAGIRIVMMTGDHAATARRIAATIGLAGEDAAVIEGRNLAPLDAMDEEEKKRILATPIFARIAPAQKLDLIGLYQQSGEIVAMTGDGVNDAPALRKADIGVAMGQRGTQVAKEAAAMVLLDDAFATIVHAVREGRVIFRNIQRFVTYLLSCNLSEILVVGLAVLAGLPLPLLPLQILFLNLVTDVFPAFALGVGTGDDGILEQRPRAPGKPILTRSLWALIVFNGIAITGATLGAFVLAHQWLTLEGDGPLTVSFLVLAFAQLWAVFNMRDPRAPAWSNDIVRNPFVWSALAGCMALLLLVVHVPSVALILSLTPLDASGWALVIGASLVPLGLVQAGKATNVRMRTLGAPRSILG